MTDREILRRLASDVVDIADDPVQQEKIDAWKKCNSLAPERPMLWITEIPWGEFADDVEELNCVCAEKRNRDIEFEFRRRIFMHRRLPCDEVIDGVFYLPKRIEGLGFGVDISEQQIEHGSGTYIRSHHYEPVISGFEDIEKVRIPKVVYHEEETLREKEYLEGIFGDILKIELQGPRQSWFPAWDMIVRWTGVTESLMALMERPEYIHALMRRVTDSMLSRMDQLEEKNLLDYPHPLARVGSGAASYTDELPQPDADPEHIRGIDQWGGATAQIFGEVSPGMHEEFALNYENEVMKRCGLNYYGCCEGLHDKMELMAKIPRLRKISISPWCDVAKAAENAARKYVFSHKPSPAILAEDKFDVERARRDLTERLEKSGDMPCEIIMKDISTVRGDVARVIAWCEMAYDLVRSQS